MLVFAWRLEHLLVTPDLLADLELFPRDQGGVGYRTHNLSLFHTVHYLLQMVHHSFTLTSTRYLQAQAVQALGNLNSSHSLNNSLSRRSLLRRLDMLELALLVRGVLLGEAVLVVIRHGLRHGLVLDTSVLRQSYFSRTSVVLQPYFSLTSA